MFLTRYLRQKTGLTRICRPYYQMVKEGDFDIEPKVLMEGSYWDQYLFPYEIGYL